MGSAVSRAKAPCGQCNRPLRYWILVHCISALEFRAGWQVDHPFLDVFLSSSWRHLCITFLVQIWLLWDRCAALLHGPSKALPQSATGILQLLQAPVRLVFFLRLCHVQSLNNNIQECVRQLTHSAAWRTSKAWQRLEMCSLIQLGTVDHSHPQSMLEINWQSFTLIYLWFLFLPVTSIFLHWTHRFLDLYVFSTCI